MDAPQTNPGETGRPRGDWRWLAWLWGSILLLLVLGGMAAFNWEALRAEWRARSFEKTPDAAHLAALLDCGAPGAPAAARMLFRRPQLAESLFRVPPPPGSPTPAPTPVVQPQPLPQALAPAGPAPDARAEAFFLGLAARARAPVDRVRALKLLYDVHADRLTLNVSEAAYRRLAERLRERLRNDPEPRLRALAARLLGLMGAQEEKNALASALGDRDGEVRCAAAEGLGLLHGVTVQLPQLDEQPGNLPPDVLAWDAPEVRIRVPAAPYVYGHSPWQRTIYLYQNTYVLNVLPTPPPTPLPVERERLIRLLAEDPDERAREGAARALLGWAPEGRQVDYTVHEWGVWIAPPGEGRLVSAETLADECPSFVCRDASTREQVSRYRLRLGEIFVDKPVLHFYCAEPLVLRVRVRFENGRPLLYWPEANDYALTNVSLDETNLSATPAPTPAPPRLSPPEHGLGFAWLRKRPCNVGYIGGSMNSKTGSDPMNSQVLTSVGLEWECLRLTPSPPPGQPPPAVDKDDQKTGWWARLREVPGCYVSNRGGTERFLFYDGETAEPPPLVFQPVARARWRVLGRNLIMLVPVYFVAGRGTTLRCTQFSISNFAQSIGTDVELDTRAPEAGGSLAPTTPEALAETLTGELTRRGLTNAEAAALLDAWRPEFFESDHPRAIYFLLREEYDRIVPLELDPAPAELVRVGIVLVPLAGDPAAALSAPPSATPSATPTP